MLDIMYFYAGNTVLFNFVLEGWRRVLYYYVADIYYIL